MKRRFDSLRSSSSPTDDEIESDKLYDQREINVLSVRSISPTKCLRRSDSSRSSVSVSESGEGQFCGRLQGYGLKSGYSLGGKVHACKSLLTDLLTRCGL